MIPDEVVERVAMAIYDEFPLLDPEGARKGYKRPRKIEWEQLASDEIAIAVKQARAALRASGYVEMREALAEYVRTFEQEFGEGEDEPDDSSVWAGMVDDGQFTFGHLRRARAALTIKRETGQ